MTTQLFEGLLQKHIAKAIDEESHALATGNPKDYAAYREVVGRIKGLNDAVGILKTVHDELYGKEKEETKT